MVVSMADGCEIRLPGRGCNNWFGDSVSWMEISVIEPKKESFSRGSAYQFASNACAAEEMVRGRLSDSTFGVWSGLVWKRKDKFRTDTWLLLLLSLGSIFSTCAYLLCFDFSLPLQRHSSVSKGTRFPLFLFRYKLGISG